MKYLENVFTYFLAVKKRKVSTDPSPLNRSEFRSYNLTQTAKAIIHKIYFQSNNLAISFAH